MEIKNKKWERLPLLVMLLFCVSAISAQKITISGKVTDEMKDPIIGATVSVKGDNTAGTITDLDGNYFLEADSKSTLVFSFIGYETQEISVNGKTQINVSLKEESVMLAEVVAIGYGVQKKKELTGAVSQIKSAEMLKIAGSDFTKTLQGKISGLNITESSGRPGDGAVIQIRGLGSINGNSSPLYVVDGIPADGNPNLPAEEIETIDVLKDGASAAVYGTRASNGVILITTKRGKAGKAKVSFSGYYGLQNIVSGTPLLSTPQQLYVDEMYQRALGGNSSDLYYNPDAMDYNTDFIGSVTLDNAPMQNYNLTVSGGSDVMTYNVNANYFKQDGILINSGYERFSTRANATFKKGRFSGFVSIGLNHSDKSVEPWNVYQFAQYQKPYMKPLNMEDGSEVEIDADNNVEHLGYLARILTNSDNRVENSHNIAANFKIEIIDGLTYQVNLGYNYWQYKRDFFEPQFMVYDKNGNLNTASSRVDASLLQEDNSSMKLTMENVLSYDKTFGKHKVGAVIGYTIEKTDWVQSAMSKKDFISNDTPVFDAGNVLTSIGGSKSTHVIVGKLFRLQYAYDGRYMLSASGRYDGSSRMAKNNRYAFFPGVSLGWNINEEKFLKNVDWLSNLKLRASYGEVGNEGIGDYKYASYIRNQIDYVWGPETGDQLGLGAIQRAYSNPNIVWETNVSKNIGLDASLLRGALSLSFDMYKNNKKDMLLDVIIPASSGTNVGWGNNSITSNIGNMVNKGFEFSATYKGHTKFGMNWSLIGTFTKNINEITSLGDMNEIPLANSKLGSWLNNDNVTTYMKVGYPAGSFFLIESDGVIQTQEELDAVKSYMPNAKLGDLKLVNQNGDNIIDDKDRVYKGSSMPKFEMGLTFNADYKGFDFSTQLYYSHKNMVYNGAKQFAYAGVRHVELYDMWTPNNINSDIPVPEPYNCNPRLDYFLEDGTFLRLRNITLGYSLPRKWFKGILDYARIYVTAQNPFTFTKYEGYDPEVGGDGVASRGVDKANYPITRKFLFGVQLDF